MSDDWGDWAAARAKLKRVMRRNERLKAAREMGTHSSTDWGVLSGVFGACVCCGTPYEDLIGSRPTKDHIKPLVVGGCDCLANLQPLCRQCNSGGDVTGDMRHAAIPGWQTIYLHRLGAYY